MTFLIALQAAQESPQVKYLVALIAAFASITVAFISAVISVISLFISRRNQSTLQREQATLSQQGKERDARRDYEYEAHKRLYTECEPLIFQLADLSEHAYHRVHSLARSARLGKLPAWLEGDGYYLRSTMYRLLAPLVIFRLIQQRLTFVDLSLDIYIANQYRLLKLLYLSFTDPFDIAAIEPKIDYQPDVRDWREQRQTSPETHWRQGLYLGTLDNAIDALVIKTDDSALRVKTYGEFELDYANKASDTYQRLASFADILYGFHPRKRPVFWRMLWTQSLIHKKILDCQWQTDSKVRAGERTSRIGFGSLSPKLPVSSLDWRQDKTEASDEEVLSIPETVARTYLQTRLPEPVGESHASISTLQPE